MKRVILSVGAALLVMGVSAAQNSGGGSSLTQVPVGQIFKNFEIPRYDTDGQRKYLISAAQARGITQNRAETTDLKIQIYDKGEVTTTITSPKADLLVADLKMRTKNTVQIVRSDIEMSADSCDFDQTNKKYILRRNVRVILKNFDTGNSMKPKNGSGAVLPTVALPVPPPPPPRKAPEGSMLDSPGSYSQGDDSLPRKDSK